MEELEKNGKIDNLEIWKARKKTVGTRLYDHPPQLSRLLDAAEGMPCFHTWCRSENQIPNWWSTVADRFLIRYLARYRSCLPGGISYAMDGVCAHVSRAGSLWQSTLHKCFPRAIYMTRPLSHHSWRANQHLNYGDLDLPSVRNVFTDCNFFVFFCHPVACVVCDYVARFFRGWTSWR